MQLGPRTVAIATPILIAFLIGAISVAAYSGHTHAVPGSNDFFVPWRATQALFLEGRNPYSADVTRDIQIAMFGQPRLPSEHQFAFAYPLPVSLLLSPLVLLPYDAAEAAWLSICLVVLVLSLFVLAGRRPPLLLAGYVLFGLFFYPSARSLILGQYAIVVFGATVFGMSALDRGGRLDVLAGALFALAALKPQVMFLTVPLILLWALHKRRWKVITSFAIALIATSALAAVLLPSWPIDFLDSLRAYDAYVEPNSPTAILLGNTVWTVVADGVLVAGLIFLVWRDSRLGWPNFGMVVGFSLIVAQTIAPRTSTTNQIMMLIPLLAWFKGLPALLQVLGMLTLTVVPWTVFLLTLNGNEEQPAAFLAVPLLCLAACGTTVAQSLREEQRNRAMRTI